MLQLHSIPRLLENLCRSPCSPSSRRQIHGNSFPRNSLEEYHDRELVVPSFSKRPDSRWTIFVRLPSTSNKKEEEREAERKREREREREKKRRNVPEKRERGRRRRKDTTLGLSFPWKLVQALIYSAVQMDQLIGRIIVTPLYKLPRIRCNAAGQNDSFTRFHLVFTFC